MDNQFDVNAEIMAMGFMFLALINTHPNKRALRSTLDSIVSDIQYVGIVGGEMPQLPHPVKHALVKYFSQLDQMIAKENP